MSLHPVIAISGIPGAGKSRAGEALAVRLGARFIPFDAFESLAERDVDVALDWLRRGAPPEDLFDPRLDVVLREAAEAGPVVLETPLGRLPPAHDALITCAIWLEVDRDIALSRKIATLLDPSEWHSAAELSGWLLQFLENYRHLVLPCLQMQAARVRPQSEHVVDGTAPPEGVDAEIARIVQTRHPDSGPAEVGRGKLNQTGAAT